MFACGKTKKDLKLRYHLHIFTYRKPFSTFCGTANVLSKAGQNEKRSNTNH